MFLIQIKTKEEIDSLDKFISTNKKISGTKVYAEILKIKKAEELAINPNYLPPKDYLL